MAHTSTARLAAAVTNAGGLGVIGGLSYTPTQLREMIHEMKTFFSSPATAKFGIDLALPSLGPTARKTNHDYTHGHLDALIDVIIEEGASLFVSAVGVPPAHVIEKLHDAGILIMNMIGHPKHAVKALNAGVDILCAQGGEGGGHTGDIASSILIPAVLDVVNSGSWTSRITGEKPLVVAAGGIYDGRGLASALIQGCAGVWVGTRFVASEEAGCSKAHKQGVVTAQFEDTIRTLVVSGRPLRVRRNEYVAAWESKPEEIRRLTESGVVPLQKDMEEGNEFDIPHLMGQVAAVIGDVKPAKVIIDEMVVDAVDRLRRGYTLTGDGGGNRKDSKL